MGSHDIYPTLSAASATWREVEVLSSNLANTSTTAFKEHLVGFELQDRGDLPLESSYVQVNASGADLTDGPVQQTGVATHLAIRGEGFLVAQSETGETSLVRSGDLRLDNQGYLSTNRGERILGKNGPIQVPQGEQIEIALDGTITTRRGDGTDFAVNEIAQLQLVTADEVEPLGGTRWQAVGPIREAENVSVIQGSLEGSNVDAIGGMVQLIQASRHFELYQKAMRTADELDGRIYQTMRG